MGSPEPVEQPPSCVRSLIGHCPGGFVVDGDQCRVNHLDIMVGANVTDGVRWIEEGVALSFKVMNRRIKSLGRWWRSVQLHIQQRVAATRYNNVFSSLAGIINARIDFAVEGWPDDDRWQVAPLPSIRDRLTLTMTSPYDSADGCSPPSGLRIAPRNAAVESPGCKNTTHATANQQRTT